MPPQRSRTGQGKGLGVQGRLDPAAVYTKVRMNTFGLRVVRLIVAALAVAAVGLRAQILESSPARHAPGGGPAICGLGQFDALAVLPHKPGQGAQGRDRWEPLPILPWLATPDRIAPRPAHWAGRTGATTRPGSALDRCRLCCWLI